MSKQLLSIPLSLFALVTVFAADGDTEKKEYSDELQRATELLIEEHYEEATTALSALREKDITTTTWGMVSFNLGIGYRLDGKHDEAIKVFMEVLESDVNDRDPGANIMEHFRNYRHKACYEISYNYEAKGEIEKALEYMELSKTKYEFQDVCGNCFEQAEERRSKRIEILTEKKNRPNQAVDTTPVSALTLSPSENS